MSLDPFGGQEEPCPNGDFEVQESGVFNIPLRGLIIGFLIFGDFVPKAFDLLTKSVFHLMVDGFTGSDGLEQSVIDRTQHDGINVFPDGIEHHGNCARGEWLAA
jgi:hypothetical protein